MINTRRRKDMPALAEPHWDLDRVYLGLNRTAFLNEILFQDFQGDIQRCAQAIGLPPNYLRDIVHATRRAGMKTLTMVYRYCIRTGRRAEMFIFTVQDKSPWEEDEPMKGAESRK